MQFPLAIIVISKLETDDSFSGREQAKSKCAQRQFETVKRVETILTALRLMVKMKSCIPRRNPFL